MSRRVLLIVIALLACPAAARAADPVLTVDPERLERALTCTGSLSAGGGTPVLLVHGTGSREDESWRSGYLYALPRAGFPACAVRLPGRAMGDIQISNEYVVHAIREMSRLSGRRVSVVGHSQGGLHPVWALRFWAGLRGSVDDVIALASPFQGTAGANDLCRDGCAPAVWQQRRGSRFLGALNHGGLPPGPSYTSLTTLYDEVAYPQPESGRLAGARNVVLQDICPGRPVDHFGIVYDNLSWELALDALTHTGPADPSRLAASVCQTATLPFDARTFTTDTALALGNVAVAFATAPQTPEEPPLFCYADPASSRGVGTTCPRAASSEGGRRPKLRLRVRPRVVDAGRRVRLRFVTTSAGRPVRGARIRIAGRVLRSGRSGRATARMRFAKPRFVRVRATRRGFRPAVGGVHVRAAGARPRYAG